MEHPIVRHLEGGDARTAAFGELAQLLYDQAALSEGGQLVNPADYVRRLNRLLVRLAVPRMSPGPIAAESLVLQGPAGRPRGPPGPSAGRSAAIRRRRAPSRWCVTRTRCSAGH